MSLELKLFPHHHIVIHRVREENPEGIRLDRFLKSRYSRRSRAQIQNAIEQGIVTLKRPSISYQPVGQIKPSTQVLFGDEVHVLTERKPEPEVSFDYKILYEDEHLLVVDKPGNLPVHPAGRFYFHTLLVHLRTAGFTLPLESDREFRLPHRIDRETSGVLCLTKTVEATAGLVEQFATRQTRKKYLAIVHGVPNESQFEVSAPLARKDDNYIKLQMSEVAIEDGGLDALTEFKVLSSHRTAQGTFSVVECHPKTGRQHQIRVHLKLAGHPIVGDKLYSVPEEIAARFFDDPRNTQTFRYISAEVQAKLMLHRHALHAAGLEFRHPITGKAMSFESPLPLELQDFLREAPSPRPVLVVPDARPSHRIRPHLTPA